MLKYIVLIAYLFSIFTLLCMVYGYMRYKLQFKTTNSIEKIIIQITTVNNHKTVNKIIQSIQSYNLKIPLEIWIVTESDNKNGYIGADKILTVPKDFISPSKYKARALDYSATIRKQLNILGDSIKILYLDDDSTPSKTYIEKCFIGDYDIMEGITAPRTNYGETIFSYVENMRVISCMSVCSIFQSYGHPVWVHGEGMCVRASTEQRVKWKFNAIASEDLIFGHKSSQLKMKWGFIWEQIYITSPWTLSDFMKQRTRWTWGNVHAITKVLSFKSAIRMIVFYSIGSSTFIISGIGMILHLYGVIYFNSTETMLIYTSFFTWIGIHGYVGYNVGNKKLKHVIISMVLAWIVSFMNIFAIFASFFMGKPNKFEVIAKERNVIGVDVFDSDIIPATN